MKHQSTDLEQVKLEIVDIWHFGLSQLIREGRMEAGRVDASVVAVFERMALVPARDFRDAVEVLAGAVLARRDFPVAAFVELMAALPLDLDELYRIYIGKNVLNNFRQANGYKSGTYIKVWLGREDNEHLFELVGELDDASGCFPTNSIALESRYAERSARARHRLIVRSASFRRLRPAPARSRIRPGSGTDRLPRLPSGRPRAATAVAASSV